MIYEEKCLWDRLAGNGRPVVLYGTGNGADRVIDELNKRNIPVAGIFASDGFVRKRTFRGFEVKTYAECRACFPDSPVLMCFGSARPEVIENALKISRECEFYAPDVPVYGDTLFDSVFFRANHERLIKIREKLADARSLDCFDNIINFKLTGEIRFLFNAESTEEDDGLPGLPVNSTYIDLGAYTGDTVISFAEKHPGYKKIIAVEPENRNFRKLRENTAYLRDITAVRAVISDCDGSTLIDGSKGMGSHEDCSGDTVPSVTADALCRDVSSQLIIKADVEGSELKMLEGARKTIKEKAPYMMIDCYHRSEDLFTLPEKVLEINPRYKIYMRHRRYIPAWETAYYFYPEK